MCYIWKDADIMTIMTTRALLSKEVPKHARNWEHILIAHTSRVGIYVMVCILSKSNTIHPLF